LLSAKRSSRAARDIDSAGELRDQPVADRRQGGEGVRLEEARLRRPSIELGLQRAAVWAR
jgi:hypothetical protein